MAVHRAPQAQAGSRWLVVIGVPVVIIAIVVAALVVFLRTPAPALARDGDLCPVEDAQITERAVLLLDLRKPLGGGGRRLVRESLDRVAVELAENAELRVFALSDAPAAPRQPIDRLCKPYGQAALAASGGFDELGCDAPPSDVAESAPEGEAARFCARRDALRESIEDLASQRSSGPVANAYLIEAIEETSLEFASAQTPKALYVFSDMIQHARWYSHAEPGPAGLSFSEFDRLRSEQSALVGPRPAPLRGVDVTVFYIPRSGATETAEERRLHTRFWEDYIADAFGAAPAFRELAAMPAYEVTPLFGQLTELEAAALERARLQQEREEAERLLAQVERERSALQEAQRAALAQAEAALEAQRQRERELAAAEAAAAEAAENATPLAEAPAEPAQPQFQVAGTAPEAVAAPNDLSLAGSPPAQPAAADTSPVDDTAPTDSPAASLAAASIAAPPPAQPELPDAPPPSTDVPAVASADGFCRPRLKSRFVGSEPEYPRRARTRFASASITVRYVLDEQGNTVDSAVAVDESLSQSSPEFFFDEFADSARDYVMRLEFDFEDTGACTRRQEGATAVTFQVR